MNEYIRSSSNSPCPVCNRTKDSDCSFTPNSELVMCKTFAGGTGHDASKWHFNGESELGFQGEFILKTEKVEVFVKPKRPKGRANYFYQDRDGVSLVKVVRIDDGDGNKKFLQSHWDGGKWLNGNPDHIKSQVPIYKYERVREAIAKQQQIFIVEGEATADRLWFMGIPATTTIGGSGGYAKYGNYLEDFAGARLILAPDRDEMGLKYIANFVRDFSAQIEGWYLAGSLQLWQNPQGGMDIADDITDHGYTAAQILDRVVLPEAFDPSPKPETAEIAELDPETDSRFYYASTYAAGLFWHTIEMKDDGLPYPKKERIGNHINAIAYTKSTDGSNTAIWLEFRTQRNSTMRLLIPRAAIAGDAMEALRSMVSSGYHYNIDKRKSLIKYLFGLGEIIDREIVIADKTGWVDGSFLTPAETYGNPDLCFRDPEPDRTLTEVKGTLDGWKTEVVAKCAGNSRLIFSLGTVFAAPLLEPAQIQSGGFHLVGVTSIGKTTALNVAAGVAGLRNIPTWRSTSNALEGKAAEFNHGLLPLDEIIQADPQTVGASAYMLGNGQGKSRMSKNLTTVKPKTWELMFLSTGEVSMIDYLQQAKIPAKGGMEVRMPSIPADANKGYGAFECLHGFEDPREFVEDLETAIRRQRGTALDVYLSKLVPARAVEGFDKKLRERVHSIAKQISQPFTDSAIGRVAVRFALVQVGLEIAHSYDLLPFPIQECAWSINEMFTAWVNSRGGDGSMEIKQACNRIEMLFISNQYNPDRIANAISPQGTKNLLAYRGNDIVTNGIEFWVPPSIFTKELADGVDKAELVKELQARGWLKPSLDKKHQTIRRRIGGQQQWFYVFHPFWQDQDEVVSVVSVVSPAENGSIAASQVRPPETTTENASGLGGLSTDIPETTETTTENAGGLTLSQSEPLSSKDSEGVRPPRPPRPPEKHVSRNEPKIILKFQPYDKVNAIDPYHARNKDCGVVKAIDSERITVVWKSDSLVRSYHSDDLELSPDIDSSGINILKSENSALQFEILSDGTIGKTVIQFEKQAIAKDWNKTISTVFGLYGELKKIESGQANRYKWQLIYPKFTLEGIDKLESKDLSQSP